MSAPAAMNAMLRTAQLVADELQQVQVTLLEREQEHATLQARHDELDVLVAAGDVQAIRDQAALRLRARQLPGEIERLRRDAERLETERHQRATVELRERQQRAREDGHARVDETWARVVVALESLARVCGAHRLAVEHLAQVEVEITGSRETARAVVERKSGAGYVVTFTDGLAGWLGHPPGVGLDLDLIDRISGEQGVALRTARAAFFDK